MSGPIISLHFVLRKTRLWNVLRLYCKVAEYREGLRLVSFVPRLATCALIALGPGTIGTSWLHLTAIIAPFVAIMIVNSHFIE